MVPILSLSLNLVCRAFLLPVLRLEAGFQTVGGTLPPPLLWSVIRLPFFVYSGRGCYAYVTSTPTRDVEIDWAILSPAPQFSVGSLALVVDSATPFFPAFSRPECEVFSPTLALSFSLSYCRHKPLVEAVSPRTCPLEWRWPLAGRASANL